MVPGPDDRRSAVMATLSALVSGLDAELGRLGYKDSLVWYRGCWRRLERFLAACSVEEFSLDMAMTWVDAACGFFEKERAGTLKPTDVYLFRVAQMLGDYAVHGAVLRRYSPAALCAALDLRTRSHQAQQANAAHNPALLIRRVMFS